MVNAINESDEEVPKPAVAKSPAPVEKFLEVKNETMERSIL